MLVKPMTFSKDGRYPTAAARAAYLERDGRAVERASWNINDEDRWAREMDRTSAQYHCRGKVVGREYVLSPSPEDGATPIQVCDFALEWVARSFPNCEAAIVVHVDNKERVAAGKEAIPHAHVYVNAPDLETGRKLTLSNMRVRELHDSAQRMCRERGWSTQVEYWDEKEQRVRFIESQRSAFERRPQWQRSARIGQEASNDAEHGQRELACRNAERAQAVRDFEATNAARGGVDYREYSAVKNGRAMDKTIIRRSLKEAVREVGENPNTTLKAELGKRGVVMEQASNGDFKYRLEGRKLEFRGKTLGRQFSRSSLHIGIVAVRELARVADQSLDQGY